MPVKKHTKLTALAANAWHALRGGERSPVCGTSTPLTDRGRRAPLLPKAHSKQWPLEDSACTCLLSGAQLERPTNTRCVRSSLLQPALSKHRLVVCVTAATATLSALCRYYGFSGLAILDRFSKFQRWCTEEANILSLYASFCVSTPCGLGVIEV